MHKVITMAAALALGTMWSVGLASAQTTTDRTESKAESTMDTIKDKAVRAKDTMKEKFAHTKDKLRSKTEQANERVAMADMRAAQDALKIQGFDPGPIDGRMGPRTRAALNDYQRKNDLPVTGMLDDATMAKLNVRSSRATDVPAASPTTQPDPKKQSE